MEQKRMSRIAALSLVLVLGLLAACARSTPTPSGREITLDDNGRMVELKIGECFLLKLGEDYDWTLEVDDMAVISRVKNIAVVRGAQGVYEALKAGTAVLSAAGEPVCRKSNPPCGRPSIAFKVTLVVR